MAIEALTKSADGQVLTPTSNEDWQDWVSASSTRNHVLNDPLLDWLKLYGERFGFERDSDLPGYDARTDMATYLFSQGNAFEAAVVAYLRTLTSVLAVAEGPADIRDLSKAEETFAAMQRGEPVIYQGVLWNAATRTYGAPDLLMRSDELQRLFPEMIASGEAQIGAPDLGGEPWH